MLPSKFRIFDARSVDSTETYKVRENRRTISRQKEKIKPEVGLIIKLSKNIKTQRKRNLGGVNRTVNDMTPYDDSNYERLKARKKAPVDSQLNYGTLESQATKMEDTRLEYKSN